MNKEPKRLSEGKAFHKKVQADWHETAQGEVESEKSVTKPSGRKGRMDIFIGGDDAKALVEIKNSDWDAMTDKAVKRNVRRQAKQIWDYIDGQPNEAEGVCPGIVFPRRPKNKDRMNLIEEMFLEQGIPVVWEDESVEERRIRG